MRHFIDEVALNLIPSSEAVNKTLATILAILIHDCIHKFLKLFYFSRYKPPGLQMTPIQILIPLTGTLPTIRFLIGFLLKYMFCSRCFKKFFVLYGCDCKD